MAKIRRFYDYDPIFRQLELFMSYNNRNSWIYDNQDNPIVSIYVRKAYHRVGKEMYHFLDLASISIDESRQGEGIFTNFLEKLIAKYPSTNIYVESILNPAVRHICQKFGFQDVDKDNMCLIQESVKSK
jgi:N-acetylglutamate synthase-like GNAT family acetyltransferase